jgi:hypothetical protein
VKPLGILPAFRRFLGLSGPTWAAWRALVGGAFGAQLSPDAVATFRELTGGRDPPAAPCRVLAFGIGRRGGKDYVAVRILIYQALFVPWTLAPGEVGVLLLIAVTKEQATIAMRYLVGALEASPVLWAEVANVTADTVVFRNRIEIRIAAADKATVRGVTLLGAILDEFAFWMNDQALEVVRALHPAMATQPNARLLIISTVYSATSPFGDMFRRSFGVDDPHTLFALATTRQMNPLITQEFIDAELARDPVANAAEYLGHFRTDVASFLDAELVDSLTRAEPRELPRMAQTGTGTPIIYVGALDVSGGKNDATAAAVAYFDGRTVRVAAARRWPSPHDPGVVARDVVEFFKGYGLRAATGDQYGAAVTTALYAQLGFALRPSDLTRSEAYLNLLPLMTQGKVELPPVPELRLELLGLERRVGRGNAKDVVDHRVGAHDDLANAVALAAVAAAKQERAADQQVVVHRHDYWQNMFGYEAPDVGRLNREI